MTAPLHKLHSLLGTFGAAFEAASAVEARRKPGKEALKALGIELKAFEAIRL